MLFCRRDREGSPYELKAQLAKESVVGFIIDQSVMYG